MQSRNGQKAACIFTSIWRKNRYFISAKQAKREKKISLYFALLLLRTLLNSVLSHVFSLLSAQLIWSSLKYLTHMNQGSRFLCHWDAHDLMLNISDVKCVIPINGIVLLLGDGTDVFWLNMPWTSAPSSITTQLVCCLSWSVISKTSAHWGIMFWCVLKALCKHFIVQGFVHLLELHLVSVDVCWLIYKTEMCWSQFTLDLRYCNIAIGSVVAILCAVSVRWATCGRPVGIMALLAAVIWVVCVRAASWPLGNSLWRRPGCVLMAT